MKIDLSNVLVVGTQETKLNIVIDKLKKYFSNVTRTQKVFDLPESYSSDYFSLIVYTDTLPELQYGPFLDYLKRSFPDAKIIGLFDKIDQGSEIFVRSAGLIYLGSFEHFNKHFHDILQSALKQNDIKVLQLLDNQ